MPTYVFRPLTKDTNSRRDSEAIWRALCTYLMDGSTSHTWVKEDGGVTFRCISDFQDDQFLANFEADLKFIQLKVAPQCTWNYTLTKLVKEGTVTPQIDKYSNFE